MENICAIDLFRRYGTIDDNLIEPRLYFYNRNIEVDFYIPEEDYAVQVSFSLSKEDTKEREVKALVGLNKLHPLKKADIVTFDEEYAIDVDELRIDVIPVWKWLLRK